jgi:ankyrin repeat protein
MSLSTAIDQGNLELVRELLNQGSQDTYLLIKATRSGNINIVREFLKQHIPTETKNQALLVAVNQGSLPIIKELLDHGANPNFNDGIPLMMAASFDNLPIVREFLNRGVNEYGGALINASGSGSINIVRELLDWKSFGFKGYTQSQIDYSLELAANKRNPIIVRELLNHGANIKRLSVKNQNRYLYLIPKVITVEEYYNLEPLSENIHETSDKYTLTVNPREPAYILLKEVSKKSTLNKFRSWLGWS